MFSGGTVLEGHEGVDQMAELLRGNTHPEFVTIMYSESGVAQEYLGVRGSGKH